MPARRLITVAGAVVVATGIGLGAIALSGQHTPPQPRTGAPPTDEPQPSGTSAAKPRAAALSASPPTAIDISRIGVHASVGTVGITAGGAMEVPARRNYDVPAWYRYSPTPGATGPSVIVGHVDSARGPSVFYRLGALRGGDTIDVRRADGRVARFTVRDTRRFAKDHFPTSLIYGDTAGPELRLITCGGSFDRSSGHYTDNVVVFATLTGSRQ